MDDQTFLKVNNKIRIVTRHTEYRTVSGKTIFMGNVPIAGVATPSIVAEDENGEIYIVPQASIAYIAIPKQ